MKAISIWQPWASAIAVGSKHYETRSWQFPKSLKGQVIAIHASKRWPREGRDYAAELKALGVDLGYDETPPLGSVVAVAMLGECLPTEALFGPDYNNPVIPNREAWIEYSLGNYGPYRFAWELTNIVKLDPIPCIGRQGFWNLEQEVERAIREQAIVDICPFSGRLCRPACDRLLCRRFA